jgi:hypothetical protein
MTVFPFFMLCQISAQTQKKVSGYLSAQYNKTIYDRTSGNNPWSVGLGFQASLNNKTKFKPLIDLTADGSIEDDDVLRLSSDGKAVSEADGVINLFAGVSFQPANQFYLSVALGPSLINGNTYFGIKPPIGFYSSKSQRLTTRISYINVFNREFNYEETKKILISVLSVFQLVLKYFNSFMKISTLQPTCKNALGFSVNLLHAFKAYRTQLCNYRFDRSRFFGTLQYYNGRDRRR